jgi:hypothetical protein
MTDLNSRIRADSPLFLIYASSINSHGQMRARRRKVKLGPEQRRIAAMYAGNAPLERELAPTRLVVEVKKLC